MAPDNFNSTADTSISRIDLNIAGIAAAIAIDIVAGSDPDIADYNRDFINRGRQEEKKFTERMLALLADTKSDETAQKAARQRVEEIYQKLVSGIIDCIVENLMTRAAQGKLPDLASLADDLSQDDVKKQKEAGWLYEGIVYIARGIAKENATPINEKVRDEMRALIKNSSDWQWTTHLLMARDKRQSRRQVADEYDQLKHNLPALLETLSTKADAIKDRRFHLYLTYLRHYFSKKTEKKFNNEIEKDLPVLKEACTVLEEAQRAGIGGTEELSAQIKQILPKLRSIADYKFSSSRLSGQVRHFEKWVERHEEMRAQKEGTGLRH